MKWYETLENCPACKEAHGYMVPCPAFEATRLSKARIVELWNQMTWELYTEELSYHQKSFSIARITVDDI